MRSSSFNGVRRGLTAIARNSLSRPVRLLLKRGLLIAEQTIFDYGCGRGGDVMRLREMGYRVSGWDPEHFPRIRKECADIVLLTYVLNVIEDYTERTATLLKAWELSRVGICISVRVDKGAVSGVPFTDGILTSRGTFQKIYNNNEFLEYINQHLDGDVEMLGQGIVFIKCRDST